MLPVILTRNVAIGNEVLFLSLNQLLIANRVMAPKNPPVATNKALIMIFHLPQGVFVVKNLQVYSQDQT